MRKISTTMAVMGLLVPMGANALGVGDIKLHSALNQLLNAEIPLVTSGSESISEVRVNLASPEAFSRAGIDRHYALSKLRFSPTQKPDGSYVIKVTSQDVIREPFLNFLLEVNWPQGRLFREFTVLLDPPATFEEPVVNTPELPEMDQRSSSFEPFNAQSTTSPRTDRGSSYRRTTSRASVEGRISGSVFGPVKRNETLWNIARLVNRDPSITHEQMAIALYRANPHAFYQDSVNALKAGEKLKIPDRETILSLSPQEAKTEFHQQAHAGKLSPRSAEKPQGETYPVSAEVGQQPQAQLKLEAPSDSKTSAESAVADSTVDTSKTKSDIALEVADTVKQENAEIRSRLAELEQQLSSMQRILSLKDAEIASLVQSREPQHVPQATPPGPTAVPEIPEPITPTTTPEPSQATVVAPESAPVTPPEPPKASPEPPAVPKPQTLPTPAPEDQGLLSELLDEPFYLALGGGGALILGLIVWLAMRRRASMMEDMESILAASEMVKPQKTATPPPLMDETPSEQLSTATKSSFLSEFTPSDFDALGGGADEVDPISEADVYLAYGRYKQAEELIRSAIEQHPERDECKLKLLEIHYATENKKAFEDYAKELFDQDKEADPNFWDKVVEMGRELCPESSLFANTFIGEMSANDDTAIRSGSRGTSADSLGLDDDLIADLRRFEQMHRQPTPETETEPARIAAPIAGDVASGLALSAQNDDRVEEFPSLQFDLSPRNQDEVAESVGGGETALDFDNLIQFETSKQPSAVSSSTPTQRDKTLDDILVELGAKSEREQASTGTAPQTIDKTKDEFDFDLELMTPPQTLTQEGTELSLAPSEVEYADLTDMDEHETRLDLAKAYVDMGDNKTALEILEDVARKGNETQKKEAKTWLDRLAKT